jgi:hypothetical protein
MQRATHTQRTPIARLAPPDNECASACAQSHAGVVVCERVRAVACRCGCVRARARSRMQVCLCASACAQSHAGVFVCERMRTVACRCVCAHARACMWAVPSLGRARRCACVRAKVPRTLSSPMERMAAMESARMILGASAACSASRNCTRQRCSTSHATCDNAVRARLCPFKVGTPCGARNRAVCLGRANQNYRVPWRRLGQRHVPQHVAPRCNSLHSWRGMMRCAPQATSSGARFGARWAG